MTIDAKTYEQLAASYPSSDLEISPWYVFVAAIFQCAAEYDAIADLWRYLETKYTNEKDQVTIARKLRESLLKGSVLVGFPKGINALSALRQEVQKTSPKVQEQLDQDKSMRGPLQRAEKDKRGKEFFSKVYAQHTNLVLNHMSQTSGGDLAEFAIDCVYGDLMAETRILNMKETGLLEFLACYATGAAPQAKGHMYGSRNLGNSRQEIEAVIEMCSILEPELGVKVRREGPAWAFVEKVQKF